jgi:putative hydroxymethylpyrimidine transport system permease protein
MKQIFKFIIYSLVLVVIWWAIKLFSGTPDFILPSPDIVIKSMIDNYYLLFSNALITLYEIIVGFILGTLLGLTTGIQLIISKNSRKLLLPFILLSQAIPIFALAPILTLWLGYGIWSKVIMTMIIIYFPITISFYEGLKRIDPMVVNLISIMGAGKLSFLFKVRIPFALPQLSSGLKLAAAFAPIGAVIGEWVGSSKGLGYLMLYASGRVQIDLMFASIIVLAIFTVILYNIVSFITNQLTKWDPKSYIN